MHKIWEDYPSDDEQQQADDDRDCDNITCKYCGRTGFNWIKLEEGWRLYNPDTGLVHKCKPRTRTMDEVLKTKF